MYDFKTDTATSSSADRTILAGLLLAAALLTGCGAATTASTSTTAPTSTTTPTTTTTSTPTVSTAPDTTDLTKLPLGDYKYVTSPAVGFVYTCSTTFNGSGASTVGPWVNSTAGTFDFTSKVVVQGAVTWPTAAFTIALSGSNRTITANDLPNHTTGIFPIAATDPAHAYDGNPNSIASQTIAYTLPANPTVAATPSCVTGGAVGFLLTGSVIFDGFDALGRDALAHEEQDSCQGHPQESSQYHYHSLTSCISDPGTGHSNLLGYALDGFGIFGSRNTDGTQLTDLDLDECHGHTHAIPWDGQTVTMYHYHATREFPYTIGCFRGTAAKSMLETTPTIPDLLKP